MSMSIRVLTACLLVPVAAVTAGCELMVAGPRAQASDIWERTYQVDPDVTLEVENTNGAITVRTHPGTTVQVKATRTAKAVTEQGARELLAKLNLENAASASRVKLVTPRPHGLSMGQQVDVRYDVLLPATATVVLTTVNGRVDVEGVTGAVSLETVNGGISGQGLLELRKAETVNGSVDLTLAGLPAGGAAIETVNGSVRVVVPSTLAADLAVRTVNGPIDVHGFSSKSDGARRRRHYAGQVNGGGSALRVETVNGGVSITGREPAATATAPAAGAP